MTNTTTHSQLPSSDDRSQHTDRRGDTDRFRRGFALPVAVFALVIVGLLVTGGFYVARQEARVGHASENGALATYIAEQGITEVMADWDPDDAWGMTNWVDTATFTGDTEEGEWSVGVVRTGDRTFFVMGEGRVTERGIYSGATRQVGMLVRSVLPDLDPPAALVTRGETRMTGSSEVAGGDSIYSNWGALGLCEPDSLEDEPGIMTDDTMQVKNSGSGNVTGDPPMEQDPSINDSTFTVFGDLTWDELVGMANITLPGTAGMDDPAPSYNVDLTCNTTDPWNWGSPRGDPAIDACAGYFPIIHITGDRATFQGGGIGQGILLVDGALDLRGGFEFHGIIIAQGSFETQGSGNRVYGGVYASNALFDSQNITGGSVINNSSCASNRAIRESTSVARPRALDARSWIDLSATQ